MLHDGAMVHLESQHGGNVRVSGDDEVNGHGKWAKLLSVELNHLK